MLKILIFLTGEGSDSFFNYRLNSYIFHLWTVINCLGNISALGMMAAL